MYSNKLYKIKTLSNLHVGNGDANYSVVDKQVQRDILDNSPMVHSSSFKGAMREFSKYKILKTASTDTVPEDTAVMGSKLLCTIFGKEPKPAQASKSNICSKAGYVRFSDVKLLALPVRTDKKSFMLATTIELLKKHINTCAIYDIALPTVSLDDMEGHYYCTGINGNVIAEELDIKVTFDEKLKTLSNLLDISEGIIVLSKNEFKRVSKYLPTIARNYLENGKSENLWYEEVVPRETLFYTVMQFPKDNVLAYQALGTKDKDGATCKAWDKEVKEFFVQFQSYITNENFYMGANTTIGYGLCNIEEVPKYTTPTQKTESQDG